MFRKTKAKIVVSIMSALVLLWFISHFVIFVSYIREYSYKNYELLEEQAHMYISESFSEDKPPKDVHNDNNKKTEKPQASLTTFYTVAFSDDGDIFETMNDKPAVRSNEELEQLAKEIVYERESDMGIDGQLLYYHIDKGTYDLVVFMDNTLIFERVASVYRYMWICSAVVFVVFFIFSIIIANMIVYPLEKGYKNQKEFVSNAGHELKTPVSVINANADILERKIGDNEWLSNIQYENERMGVLVAHLLELSRTESVPAKMEFVDLSRLVQGEALPFESVAFEKGLELVSDIAPNIKINGNQTQLEEVVSILLDNAIQHCNYASPKIQLQLKKECYRYAKLSVINSADNIPKEERDKIFERFYSANETQNGTNKHYGLGLAIAKNIVESHKGKIKVLCYDGKVEFQVVFPLNVKMK